MNDCTIAQLDTILHGKLTVTQNRQCIKFSDESSKLVYHVNISDNDIEVEYSSSNESN